MHPQSHQRRAVAVVAAAAVLCACVGTTGGAAPDTPRSDLPNIIFVLADDMGWGDVSYNTIKYLPGAGGENWKFNPPHTPNLDAMATSENSILFHRFYSGSPVCSPTRSAALTGRSPDRECIFSAEGCGQKPAWSCFAPYPLPTPTFTVAEAAKAMNYSTIHLGKWHLGDFWIKDRKTQGDYPTTVWPSSNPGMHGFDEWYKDQAMLQHSTEASAASSTTNCGCNPEWKFQGQGCITGGGVWQNVSYACTNYWSPTDLSPLHEPTRPECRNSTTITRDCVANLTAKITGDDSEHMMDVFEDFLKRKSSGPEQSPFMAHIWLHTNHEPHPSLPQYYFGYNDTFGNPAGDYLGTLTQMDVQIGRLRTMLRTYGVADNTMLWFTADNGPHTSTTAGDRDSNQATLGLRQCKASVFEGGIREPGILEWPARIKANRETWFPAYVSDYLPTTLDLFGMAHPQPTWHHDGISLMPLINGDTGNRTKPLVFKLGSQVAVINGSYKIVTEPAKGQCKEFLPPWGKMKDLKGPFLFDLEADPTESVDISAKEPALLASMTAAMNEFVASLTDSQIHESGCKPGGNLPPTPPAGGASLKNGTSCLTITSTSNHSPLVLGPCDGGSKWSVSSDGEAANIANQLCIKVKEENVPAGDACKPGLAVVVGACTEKLLKLRDGILLADACSGMCALAGPAGSTLVPCVNATHFVAQS